MGSIDSRLVILQALVRGESYGLELIERVHDATNGTVRLQQGRVYPVLRSLEAEGLVESFDGPSMRERGGRPRRYYRLTAIGQRAAKLEARAVFALIQPALGRA